MKTPVAIASTKPFLCDFSDKGLRKTALHTTNAAVKELLLKNGESQFVFRADTQSFASKKRKIAHEGANNASLPFKIGRATGKFGLVLNRTIPNKEKGKDVISEACIGKAKLVQVASKISETSVKQDDNVVSKKRGLLSAAAKAGPPLKKSKSIFQTADVSESLLDALTDLMAEEAGIGVEKLASHMDVDVDVNDPIVQDEIQMFQC
ncbi:hypothetical protein PsorP6_001164 [Peronosclerospora sorghi]|uniref:Uncharacterized protein n=1 Tax=Peronosclerospora sorghi TaxID=230839 RepID=A0ACC0WTV7_9STRA|nr:hypothetical protein PsorP6_001164 [Peronosclerospora sorghi]